MGERTTDALEDAYARIKDLEAALTRAEGERDELKAHPPVMIDTEREAALATRLTRAREDWTVLHDALKSHRAGECPVGICSDGESFCFCGQMREAFETFTELLAVEPANSPKTVLDRGGDVG